MPKLPPCLSSIRFAALLAYSPRGQSATSVQSRQVRDVVKRDSVWPGQEKPFIQVAVERLAADLVAVGLAEFFGKDVALVPAPRSAPLTKGALWPGRRVCEELERVKLGGPVLTCLERTVPVQKAAFAGGAGRSRPTVAEHLASMRCQGGLLAPKALLLVDDVVTSGSMLISGATLVQDAFPEAEVRAFALVRTMSYGDVERVLEPCAGVISYEGGPYARREP